MSKDMSSPQDLHWPTAHFQTKPRYDVEERRRVVQLTSGLELKRDVPSEMGVRNVHSREPDETGDDNMRLLNIYHVKQPK